MNELIPMAPEGAKLPAQVAVAPDALDLDMTGVEQAAKRMGLRRVKGADLLATHTLGTAIKKLGAIKVGRSILFAAAANSQDAIAQCDNIIDQTDGNAELQLNALEVKQKLVRGQAEIGSRFIKSVEVDGSDDAKPVGLARAFGPGQMAGPVVIAQTAQVVQNAG